MTMHKKVENRLRKAEAGLEKILEQKRVEWLQQIYREARDRYSFKKSGELITFIVDHANDIALE